MKILLGKNVIDIDTIAQITDGGDNNYQIFAYDNYGAVYNFPVYLTKDQYEILIGELSVSLGFEEDEPEAPHTDVTFDNTSGHFVTEPAA